MLKFEMEAPIVMESKEEIVEALREMADAIEDGVERDWIKGEIQCMEWYIEEDDGDGDDDGEDYETLDEEPEYIGFADEYKDEDEEDDD